MTDLSPVTYMDPSEVLYALDGSVDTDDWCYSCEEIEGEGYTCSNPAGHWQDNLLELFMEKYEEVFEDFITSICENGVKMPICVTIESDGRWFQGNGHHRLIVAAMENLPLIPVVFAFDGDYMHRETTGSLDEMNFMGETNWDPYDS